MTRWSIVNRDGRVVGVFVAGVMLALAYFVYFLVDIINGSVGFDSAYNLFVPQNLADGDGYVSYAMFEGGRERLFDPRVTTGPTMLLPLVIPFALLDGPAAIYLARIIVAIGYLFLVWGIYRIGKRIAGSVGALAAATVPLLFIGETSPSGVLGDVWASAFLVWAVVYMPHRTRAVGLLLGLAVLTKLSAMLAVPFFGMWVLFQVWRERGWNWRAIFGRGTLVAALIVAPSAAWELVRFVWLGPSGYIDNVQAFVTFFRHASSKNVGSLINNTGKFIAVSDFSQGLNLALVILIVASALILTVRLLRRRLDEVAASETAHIAIFALAQLALWSVWWIGFNGGFFRHVLPGLFLSLPILAAALVRLFHETSGSQVVRGLAVIPAVLVIGSIALQYPGKMMSELHPERTTFAEQVAVANAVADAPGEIVSTSTRRLIFDIELIAGREVRLIEESEILEGQILVVSTNAPGKRRYLPERETAANRVIDGHCGLILSKVRNFTVCVTGAPSQPTSN